MPTSRSERVARAARTALSALRQLALNGEVSLTAITDAVQARRGRPLRVSVLEGLAGEEVCGLWLVTDREDIILHAPSESPFHTQQFVLHELAHMILGHDTAGEDAPDIRGLLPDIPQGAVRRLLARSHFTDEAEVTAEILADLLAESMRHAADPRSPFLRVFS